MILGTTVSCTGTINFNSSTSLQFINFTSFIMFSLLLAIVISSSLCHNSVASLQGSLGFGGSELHRPYMSPNYGFGPHYYGSPEYSYFGSHRGFSGYSQGAYSYQTPYSYLYRGSASGPSQPRETYRNNIPQSSVYPCSKYTSDQQYRLKPYFESFEIYSMYKAPTISQEPINSLEGQKRVSNINVSSDVLNYINSSSLSPLRNESSANSDKKDFQLTYLGYMPSALITDLQETDKKSSNRGNDKVVPFYPLYGEHSKRSESSAPLLLYSPYRVGGNSRAQSFSSFQQQSTDNSMRPLIPSYLLNPFGSALGTRPPVSRYPNSYKPTTISTTTTQFTSVQSSPTVSPFRSGSPSQILGSSLSLPYPARYARNPNQGTQNGYYLFDVEPLKAINEGNSYSYPTFNSEEPYSKIAQSIYQQGKQFLDFPQRNSGFETSLPYERTGPNFHFDRLSPIQQNEQYTQNQNSEQQLVFQRFGPAEMRQLVGRLLTLKRAPQFYSRYTT